MTGIDHSLPFQPLRLAVLTVSNTRTLKDDKSGDVLVARLSRDGHVLAARDLVRDDAQVIAALFRRWIDDPAIDVVVSTGGTGLTGFDVTPEALDAVAEKTIPGFGEMFRWISYQKIKTSALQSRACAGVARGTYLFCLPGSSGACCDGWDEILRYQLDSRHRPCNFAELIPRLREHETA